MGFSANVRFIDDEQYDGLTGTEIIDKIPNLREYGCVFIADAISMSSDEHHLLVIDPNNPKRKTFRVILSELWGVETNLSIANMEYSDFSDAVDTDSIFRGYK